MSRWLEAFLCDVLGWHDMEEVYYSREAAVRYKVQNPTKFCDFADSPVMGRKLSRYECKRAGCDQARDEIEAYKQQVIRETLIWSETATEKFMRDVARGHE